MYITNLIRSGPSEGDPDRGAREPRGDQQDHPGSDSGKGATAERVREPKGGQGRV